MRCKICGAKLKSDGDICTYCYKLYQEEEDLKKDTTERLKFKRKYSIVYEVSKYLEVTLVFILALFVCIASGGILEGLLVVLIYVVLLGALLFLDKRLSMGTQVIFYNKKAVYKFDFAFIHKEKTVRYTDLKDITYFQTHRQKNFGYGDLCVYTKETIPGAGFLKGFQVKNVEDIKEKLEKIAEIVGTIE